LGAQSGAICISNSDGVRNERSALLKAALVADKFDTMQIFSDSNQIPSVLNEFLFTPEAGKVIAPLRKALAHYELSYSENFLYMSPRIRAEEHKRKLTSPNVSDEVITAIMEESQILSHAHFQTIAIQKIRALSDQYRAKVKPLLDELLNAALEFVRAKKNAAIADEKWLSAEHKVAYSPTAASKQYDSIISSLEHRINFKPALPAIPTMPATPANPYPSTGTAPQADTDLQSIFGVKTLADQIN
jgi:hypothetical protein